MSSAGVSGSTYKRLNETNAVVEYSPGSLFVWRNYAAYVTTSGSLKSATSIKFHHKN